MFGLKPKEEEVILRQKSAGTALRIMKLAVDGVTCDECMVKLELPHQAVSARFYDLVHSGCLKATGIRRKTRMGGNAQVYKVPDGTLFSSYLSRTPRIKKHQETNISPLDSEILAEAYHFMRRWPNAGRHAQEKLVLRLVSELGDRLSPKLKG